jgi:hypothetical protein
MPLLLKNRNTGKPSSSYNKRSKASCDSEGKYFENENISE